MDRIVLGCLNELNRTASIQSAPEDIEARAEELPEEFAHDLQRCALFELEVTGNDAEFDPADYGDPDTALKASAKSVRLCRQRESGALSWTNRRRNDSGTSAFHQSQRSIPLASRDLPCRQPMPPPGQWPDR